MRSAVPKAPPPPIQLQPAFEMTMCPFCGMPARWRFDKKGRPMHFCAECGIRVFIYGSAGLVGFEMLYQLAARVGPVRWRQEAQSRITRRHVSKVRALRAGAR